MSTVRIYKVAELLNTTSQEVLELLKKAHGIELKSASSTLEEIVARQFVDRLAKQRGIELPKGDVFSEQAVKPAAKGKATPGKKGSAAAPPEPAQAGDADAWAAAPDQEGQAGRTTARGRSPPSRSLRRRWTLSRRQRSTLPSRLHPKSSIESPASSR